LRARIHKYDYCHSGHSNDYCSQYVLGYGDEWNRIIQKDFGTEQTQGASVDVHGNNNKVNIEQDSSRLIQDSADPVAAMDRTPPVRRFVW